MAKKTIEQLFKENGEDIKIQVVCIQCPTDPHGVYYYDEEFIFYRPFADPDISILYLKDW